MEKEELKNPTGIRKHSLSCIDCLIWWQMYFYTQKTQRLQFKTLKYIFPTKTKQYRIRSMFYKSVKTRILFKLKNADQFWCQISTFHNHTPWQAMKRCTLGVRFPLSKIKIGYICIYIPYIYELFRKTKVVVCKNFLKLKTNFNTHCLLEIHGR